MMQNPWYLFVIYGLVWVGIFLFSRRLSGHQRDLEEEADRLADAVPDRDEAGWP